jgi:hypothetical protein
VVLAGFRAPEPHTYSAYGKPGRRMDSGKEVEMFRGISKD